MELYQLKCFLSIAEARNLTRAAQGLATSQPALSAQLKSLEDELGVVLFSRTSRGMELTEAGKALSAHALEICQKAEELKALAATLGDRVLGTCRIGLNTEAGILRIPQLVELLAERAPDLGVELIQGVTRSITDGIKAGELEAGFVFGRPAPGLDSIFLANIGLTLAAPAGWKNRLSEATLNELLKEPWVLPPKDCPFQEPIAALFSLRAYTSDKEQAAASNFSACRATPQGITADHEFTILRLVSSGAGLSLLPDFMLQEAEKRNEIIRIQAVRSEIGLAFVWRSKGSKGGSDQRSKQTEVLRSAVSDVWSIS